MGLDESKIVQTHKNAASQYKLCVSAPVVPWRIIHQCSIDLWLKSHRESFNFPDKTLTCNYQIPYDCTPAFCLSRQNIINFRKTYSVFSLRKRKKSSKMAEHFEYNHLPARLSSIQNLHFKSVLAIHSGLAVVHLARDLVTQFAILDLRINKFLGTFGRQTVNVNTESTTGKISPDGCWCLIKLPSSRNRRVSVLKLYDLRSCELLTELLLSPIPRLLFIPVAPASSLVRGPLLPSQVENTSSNFTTNPWISSGVADNGPFSTHGPSQSVYENGYQVILHRSAPILYAFDPRFLNSRVAITNLSSDPIDNDDGPLRYSDESTVIKASVSLLKLPTWERLTTSTKFKCSMNTARSLSASNPSRFHSVSGQQTVPSSSSGSMLRAAAPRRRRSSETNHGIEPAAIPSNLPFPHILSIFYSRDGYLLFTVSTDQRVCKCATLGHFASGSSLHCASADSINLMDDMRRGGLSIPPNRAMDGTRLSHPHIARDLGSSNHHIPEASAHYTCAAGMSSRLSEGSDSLAPPPPPPGCTVLWLTIFNSDTLNRLRTLRFDRAICPIHTCPTNYLPVMSRCGSRLALLTNKYVCPTTHHTRSMLPSSYCYTYGVGGTGSNALRHSIPSATMDILNQTQLDCPRFTDSKDSRAGSAQLHRHLQTGTQSIEINRTLTNSSPSLPPFERDGAIDRAGLCITDPISSSFPTPLARVHFADDFTATRQTDRSLCDCQFSACTNSSSSVPVISASSSNRRHIEVVLVYQLPPPPSLQALVRQRILQLCRDDVLDKLNLPPQMISYLRFQPVFSSAGSQLSRSSSLTATLHNFSLDRTSVS